MQTREDLVDHRIISPIPKEVVPRMFTAVNELFARQMIDDSLPNTVEAWEKMITQYSFAIVDRRGEFVGAVWGNQAAADILLGHFVFLPKAITPQQKLAAVEACLGSMFSSGIRKIIWMSFADNHAFINFLTKRIGATQEGYLRQQERRNGALVDVVMLASFAENFNVPGRSTTQSVRKSYKM